MKIGDIARRLGTTERTLRYYEQRGLINPRRSAGGTRHYDEQDEARFAALLALSRLDIPLEQLNELAATRAASPNGDTASHQVVEHLGKIKRHLTEQAAAIATMLHDLNKAEALVRQCFGCEQAPTQAICSTCEISAAVSTSQVLQVVWDEPQRE